MYIIYTPKPDDVSAHQIGQINIISSTLAVVTVNGLRFDGSDQTFDPNPLATPSTLNTWSERIEFPPSALSSDPSLSVAQWLASEDGPFSGGEVVSEDGFALAFAKNNAKAKAKNIRDQKWSGVAPTPFGPVDIHSDGKGNIKGFLDMIRLAEKFGQPLTEIVFTMANNVDVTFTPAEFEQMALAVGVYVNGVHRRKRDLGVLIDEAATIEDLNAIDITAGWPG